MRKKVVSKDLLGSNESNDNISIFLKKEKYTLCHHKFPLKYKMFMTHNKTSQIQKYS